MDPAAVLADRPGDDVDEGGDVVVGDPLALLDRLDRERGAGPRRLGGLRGTTPSSAQASVAASSTSSQHSSFALLGPDGRRSLGGCSRGITQPAGGSAHRGCSVDYPDAQAGVLRSVDRDAGDRHAGRHLHRGEQRVEAAEALAEDRHADHRQVGVGGGDPGQRRRHPGPGDDHLQPAHPGVGAVLADQLGVAVGAHHPHLVADAGLLQRRAGRLHLRLVVLRAHDDPDQGLVDVDLLEGLLDRRHRGRGRRLGSRAPLRSRSSLPLWCHWGRAPRRGRRCRSRICIPSKEIRPPHRMRDRAPRPVSPRAPVTLRTRPPAVTISPSRSRRPGMGHLGDLRRLVEAADRRRPSTRTPGSRPRRGPASPPSPRRTPPRRRPVRPARAPPGRGRGGRSAAAAAPPASRGRRSGR